MFLHMSLQAFLMQLLQLVDQYFVLRSLTECIMFLPNTKAARQDFAVHICKACGCMLC